jgi:hypothetical protein
MVTFGYINTLQYYTYWTNTEKVHSQGRVLGDRSVLYKYINSNLVAILSSNKVDLSLHVNLIDIVSGQLIFTGKYSRAQAPYHIVHCENWILVVKSS